MLALALAHRGGDKQRQCIASAVRKIFPAAAPFSFPRCPPPRPHGVPEDPPWKRRIRQEVKSESYFPGRFLLVSFLLGARRFLRLLRPFVLFSSSARYFPILCPSSRLSRCVFAIEWDGITRQNCGTRTCRTQSRRSCWRVAPISGASSLKPSVRPRGLVSRKWKRDISLFAASQTQRRLEETLAIRGDSALAATWNSFISISPVSVSSCASIFVINAASYNARCPHRGVTVIIYLLCMITLPPRWDGPSALVN